MVFWGVRSTKKVMGHLYLTLLRGWSLSNIKTLAPLQNENEKVTIKFESKDLYISRCFVINLFIFSYKKFHFLFNEKFDEKQKGKFFMWIRLVLRIRNFYLTITELIERVKFISIVWVMKSDFLWQFYLRLKTDKLFRGCPLIMSWRNPSSFTIPSSLLESDKNSQ